MAAILLLIRTFRQKSVKVYFELTNKCHTVLPSMILGVVTKGLLGWTSSLETGPLKNVIFLAKSFRGGFVDEEVEVHRGADPPFIYAKYLNRDDISRIC
jgi:hypothetical protein